MGLFMTLMRRPKPGRDPRYTRLTRIEQVGPNKTIVDARKEIFRLQARVDELTDEDLQSWTPEIKKLVLEQIDATFALMRGYRDMFDHLHDSASKLNDYIYERDMAELKEKIALSEENEP